MAGLHSFWAEQYRKGLRLEDVAGSAGFKKILKNNTAGLTNQARQMGPMNRYLEYLKIKYGYPLGIRYSVERIILTIPNGKDYHHVVIGYLYWREDKRVVLSKSGGARYATDPSDASAGSAESDPAGGDPDESDPDESNHEIPEYICSFYLYESNDGEYRKQVDRFKDFTTNVEKLGKNKRIEADLRQLLAEEKIELETQSFGTTRPENQYISFGCLLMYVNSVLFRPTEHMSEAHKPVKKFLEEIIGREEGDSDAIMGADSSDCVKIYCGQKIRPLTHGEVTHPESIIYPAWQELDVGILTTDLVINGIAPGFPILSSYTILQNTGKEFYENKSMRRLFDRTKKVLETVGELSKIREEISGDDEWSDDFIFGQFDKRLFEAYEFAQAQAITSSASLLDFSEVVGTTLGTLHVTFPRFKDDYRNLFKNPHQFSRLIFDLCWSARALHERLGCVHGDAHMNNLTYYHLVGYLGMRGKIGKGVGSEFVEKYEHPTIAFIGNDESDSYFLEHLGFYGVIIDWSRMLLGSGYVDRLAGEHGKHVAESVRTDQYSKLLKTFHRYDKDFAAKHSTELRRAVYEQFDDSMRAISAIDFLAIGRAATNLAANARAAGLEPHPDCLELGRVLEKAGRDEFIRRTRLLITPANRKSELNRTWPGPAVARRAFARYSFPERAKNAEAETATPLPKIEDAEVVDMFQLGRPLRYSSKNYESFPEWAKYESIRPHLGDIKFEDLASRGPEVLLERFRDLADGELSAIAAEVEIADDFIHLSAPDVSSW